MFGRDCSKRPPTSQVQAAATSAGRSPSELSASYLSDFWEGLPRFRFHGMVGVSFGLCGHHDNYKHDTQRLS